MHEEIENDEKTVTIALIHIFKREQMKEKAYLFSIA